MHKTKRQMIIRIHFNNVIYIFESDLGTLKKLSDGHRHRVGNSVRRELMNLVLVLFYTESGSGSDCEV